jgi:hypothetical protein
MHISKLVGKTLNETPIQPDPSRPLESSSVGIEVEVEGIDPYNDEFVFWRIAGDGSLQGGVEFISQPVWGTGITSALSELDTCLKKHKPYLSFRTSVHVHVNALDLDTNQLIHFIKLYLMYEPALFRLHKEWNRYENIFCVPAMKSTAIQRGYLNLLYDLENEQLRDSYVSYKYSALNPNSLTRFGTLEFRHMGGCCDVDKIDRWINILLQLKSAAIDQTDITKSSDVFQNLHSSMNIKANDLVEGREMLEFIQLNKG